jgi:hypothetical protein
VLLGQLQCKFTQMPLIRLKLSPFPLPTRFHTLSHLG